MRYLSIKVQNNHYKETVRIRNMNFSGSDDETFVISLEKAILHLAWNELKDNLTIKEDLQKGINMFLKDAIDRISVEQLEEFMKTDLGSNSNRILKNNNLDTCLLNLRNTKELQTFFVMELYEQHSESEDPKSS